MKNFLIFFFVLGVCALCYFSYITLISHSLKNQPKTEPSETERILAEQRMRSESLNQDYRRLMEDNRRALEQNRRAMEDLRRQSQR
jgi:hypothetical protein